MNCWHMYKDKFWILNLKDPLTRVHAAWLRPYLKFLIADKSTNCFGLPSGGNRKFFLLAYNRNLPRFKIQRTTLVHWTWFQPIAVQRSNSLNIAKSCSVIDPLLSILVVRTIHAQMHESFIPECRDFVSGIGLLAHDPDF